MSQQCAAVQIHDYRARYWGHDYIWRPSENSDGKQGTASGWGPGIKEGDWILMQGPSGGGSPYRVVGIAYLLDPEDMWEARLVYDLNFPADAPLLSQRDWA